MISDAALDLFALLLCSLPVVLDLVRFSRVSSEKRGDRDEKKDDSEEDAGKEGSAGSASPCM